MKLNSILFLITLFAVKLSFAQESDYTFPIRPGKANYLTGTMGELRGSHFHAGIDIKTGGREGYNVYATASGYINRIKVSTGGYGNALYLKHDDGNISVYAHLQHFSPKIQEYLTEQQYANRSFEVNLFPEAEQFRFNKGKVIGVSGNSGSSTGPHLHFEIRDPYHHPLNPLTFDFTEVRDNIPPRSTGIALMTRNRNSRINGEFGWKEFNLRENQNGIFELSQTPKVWGTVGIELAAFDRLNGVLNRNGFPCIEIYVDDEQIFSQNIQKLDFAKAREIYLVTNVEKYRETRKRYQRLYREDGFTYEFYQKMVNDAFFTITDSALHQVHIVLSDTYGNQREIQFKLQGEKSAPVVCDQESFVQQNYVVAEVRQDSAYPARLHTESLIYDIKPEYHCQDIYTYIWDLRLGLPDSIVFQNEVRKYPYSHTFYPGEYQSYVDDRIEFRSSPYTLFDTAYLNVSYQYDSLAGREIFAVESDRELPLRGNYNLTLKPKKNYDPEKYSLFQISNGRHYYVGGEWNGNEFHSKLRDLGRFTFVSDTISPTIRTLSLENGDFKILVSDDFSGVKDYRASVNGKWILLAYDAKNNLLFKQHGDPNIPQSGEFTIEVSDQIGNKTIYEQTY